MYDEDPDRQESMDYVLGQTATLLHRRGDDQAVALLLDVEAIDFAQGDEVVGYDDSWGSNWPVYNQVAVLDVEDHLVERFTPEVCERIAEVLGYVAERNHFQRVTAIKPRAALPVVEDRWRETLGARLDLDRPSNQARRERDQPSLPAEDGLTFASQEELRVYRALKDFQGRCPEDRTIAILPLPGARLRAGHTWSPDLLVVGNGRALIFEVDGPHHRDARRYADDQNRDLQWKRCGVPVVRLAVEDLRDDDSLANRLREEVRRHLGGT